MTGFWTPARVDLLRRYHADFSAREIADWLQCSKNAVIGKAHRLGLPIIPRDERSRRNVKNWGVANASRA